MNNYMVVRHILFVRGDVLTIAIQLFDDMDGADDFCRKLDSSLVSYMECDMVHPVDKGVATMAGTDFLASLGIASIIHKAVEMPVKQSSLIKVPHLELIKQ